MIIRRFAIAAFVLLAAAPAFATPVTLSFSGTMDLTLSGGPATAPFQGAVTWDAATAAVLSSSSTAARYSFLSATFFLNGTDDTANILAPSLSGSFVQVDNGAGFDAVRLFLNFSPMITFGFQSFTLILQGPVTMFSSTALPADLGFLSSVTAPNAVFICDFFANPCFGGLASSLVINQPSGTPVPEPVSMVLVGSGLGLAALRRRRRV